MWMAKAEDADRKDNKRGLAFLNAPRKFPTVHCICRGFCSALVEYFRAAAQPVLLQFHMTETMRLGIVCDMNKNTYISTIHN